MERSLKQSPKTFIKTTEVLLNVDDFLPHDSITSLPDDFGPPRRQRCGSFDNGSLFEICKMVD